MATKSEDFDRFPIVIAWNTGKGIRRKNLLLFVFLVALAIAVGSSGGTDDVTTAGVTVIVAIVIFLFNEVIRARRVLPNYARYEITADEVRCTETNTSWTEPLKSYDSVDWCLSVRVHDGLQHKARSTTGWVVLRHGTNGERSVVLWKSSLLKGETQGKAVLRAAAKILGLPAKQDGSDRLYGSVSLGDIVVYN